jgi:hypothetical protein
MEPVSLPFSVSRSKGAYALLLGSGMSRSAQIMTGWDITRDLIRQVALLRGQTININEAEAWYWERFELPPDYSDLLKTLARRPADRNAILRRYFVPTQEEREQNIKVPQDGHYAIAELVAAGYVRVIVTTNFDPLIEDSLTQAGIDAQVISTADGIKGATPLPHAACTVLKVNGDFRDDRIRNTKDELSKYPPPFNRLLDRIFDDYGLIVCGWSCEWDPALRAALERRPNRRYTTYWTHLSPLKEPAQRLTAHLIAETIQISGADQFFRNLSESVKTIEDTAQPHPLSARVAEATVKRYVVDDRYRVLLNDLVMGEVTRAHEAVTGPSSPSVDERISGEELASRLAFYESQARSLMAVAVAGCYWGEERHHRLWRRAMKRISRLDIPMGGNYEHALFLRLYPAILVLYAGGIAAIAADRYDTLAALLLQEGWPERDTQEYKPLVVYLNPEDILDKQIMKTMPAMATSRTPASDYLCLHSGLRQATHDAWFAEENYEAQFDWFEFFAALVNWDLTDRMGDDPWPMRGRFIWRGNRTQKPESILSARRFSEEIEASGPEWAPLRAGFFGGSSDRAREVLQRYLGLLGAARSL